MIFLVYLFSLISIPLIAILVILLNNIFGGEFHWVFIWWIFPLAGFALGMMWVTIFLFWKRFIHSETTWFDLLIAAILWILTFLSVNYVSYMETFTKVDIKDTDKVFKQLQNPQKYAMNEDIPTFVEYMKIINSSRDYRYDRLSENAEFSGEEKSFLFYIQVLWALIWSIYFAYTFLNFEYCKKCKRYHINKVLKKFCVKDFDKYYESINDNIDSVFRLKDNIGRFEDRTKKSKKYCELAVLYCPECYKGVLWFKFLEVKKNGKTKELDDLEKRLDLKYEVVRELLKDDDKIDYESSIVKMYRRLKEKDVPVIFYGFLFLGLLLLIIFVFSWMVG